MDSKLLISISSALISIPVGLISSGFLQWARKEIDDYRGRVINLFLFPQENHRPPMKQKGPLSKVTGWLETKDPTIWYGYTDRHLINRLAELDKHLRQHYGGEYCERMCNYQICYDGKAISWGNTVNLLKKRMQSKQGAIIFLTISLAILGLGIYFGLYSLEVGPGILSILLFMFAWLICLLVEGYA